MLMAMDAMASWRPPLRCVTAQGGGMKPKRSFQSRPATDCGQWKLVGVNRSGVRLVVIVAAARAVIVTVY